VEALNLLNRLIIEGVEYPEAEYRVAIKFNLNRSQINKLRELYDKQN
jgi:hypothetical protein